MQTLIRGETSYRLLFKDVRVDWKEIKFPLFQRTNICSIRYARIMEIFRGSRTGQKNLFVGDCDANDDDRHNAAVRWGGQWLERGLISIDPHSGHYSTNLQFPDEHNTFSMDVFTEFSDMKDIGVYEALFITLPIVFIVLAILLLVYSQNRRKVRRAPYWKIPQNKFPW